MPKLLDKIDDLIKESYRTRSIIISKDQRSYNKLLGKLRDAIINASDENIKSAYVKAIDYLKSVNAETFSETDAVKISTIVGDSLGVDLETSVKNDVEKLTSDILKLGKKEVMQAAGFKFSFDVADQEAADILAKQNLFWIGNGYGDNMKKAMDKILDGYFTGNKTIDEVTNDLTDKFNKLGERSRDYYESLAEHQTTTVRELGKVNGFEAAGIKSYEIKAIIDDRTSEICQFLDGTVFTIDRAIEYRDNILSLDDPEEIKKASPWLTADEVAQLDPDNLPPGLSLPPYHFNCRTIVVANF